MAKHSCDIYGPDLEIHERQGGEIAVVGLKSVRGDRATDQQEKSTGPDASKNGLERMENK
jgi:hypothetical protein